MDRYFSRKSVGDERASARSACARAGQEIMMDQGLAWSVTAHFLCPGTQMDGSCASQLLKWA